MRRRHRGGRYGDMAAWGARVATAASVTRAAQGPPNPVTTVTPVTPSADRPLDPTTLADAFGIHFVAQAVADGAPPTLPNGQQGVPMDQAIRAAMDAAPAGVDYQAHSLLPNVQVSAQYTLYSNDLAAMADELDTRWLIADYEAGDMVVHSPYMVHASTMNVDPDRRIRLSTDIRYQRVRDEIDVRWNNHWSFDDML